MLLYSGPLPAMHGPLNTSVESNTTTAAAFLLQSRHSYLISAPLVLPSKTATLDPQVPPSPTTTIDSAVSTPRSLLQPRTFSYFESLFHDDHKPITMSGPKQEIVVYKHSSTGETPDVLLMSKAQLEENMSASTSHPSRRYTQAPSPYRYPLCQH